MSSKLELCNLYEASADIKGTLQYHVNSTCKGLKLHFHECFRCENHLLEYTG